MQVDKILFPTDLSEHSNQAIHYATAICRAVNAELLIIHVREQIAAYTTGGVTTHIIHKQQIDLKEMMYGITPPEDIRFSHHLIDGLPAHAVVKMAEEQGVGMIVMSTHGRTGLSRLLMGSVAEQIVRKAPCPVITVRQPENVPAVT